MSNYGTPNSPLLKDLQAAGFKVLAITIMVCEETFVFQTKEEVDAAVEWVNRPDSIWKNEGWWYALEDDECPWDQTLTEYREQYYKNELENAPKVYWLNDGTIQ